MPGSVALPSDAVQALLLELATEHSVEGTLGRIVRRLAELPAVALARIWLIRDGELALVASAGRPLAKRADWSRTDGDFARFPLGVGKVGEVAASGKALVVNDFAHDARALRRPEWARAERIAAFGGQPLRFRDRTLGVLALFLRSRFSQADRDRLRTVANHAAASLETARAFEEIERLRAQLEARNAYLQQDALADPAFLGGSPAAERVREQVALVAPTDATVLVTGESGTGKEVVAQMVHAASARRSGPMIRVNCAATPRELFESEFFGHVRGAFSGATGDRIGRFAAADGGTLFLDEVAEIPAELQAKLLRVLQDGEYLRVGESVPRRADVRIVAATNQDLDAARRAGRFREDLYYRLDVFPIAVPPLRDRRADVGELARHFLRRAAPGAERRLTEADVARLAAYDWPGNVRELSNVVARALIVSRTGPLQLALPETRAHPAAPAPRGDEAPLLTESDLARIAEENLRRALARTEGRVHGPRGAARLLGVKPTTLLSRMKRLGLPRR
jgi:transcriptional regulator with GAF, ATPase, and Fis domain